MHFEVFPVKAPDSTIDSSNIDRTIKVVAEEIKDIYTRVEGLSGKVIAQHELRMPGDAAHGVGERSFLFLVAQIEPEQIK